MSEEELMDKIEEWHSGDFDDIPLHKYLGWTAAELAYWVETNEQPKR